MGRGQSRRRRRSCAVKQQTPSAGATPTQATNEENVARTLNPLPLARSASPSLQHICGVSHVDILLPELENETFPQPQRQRLHRHQVPFQEEPQVSDQEQQRSCSTFSVVAFHARSAGGSAFPIGGAAGATELGVIRLFRERYNSSTGRRARSSLPAYNTSFQRTRGRGGVYTRGSREGDDDLEERRLMRQRCASSGSSRLPSRPLLSCAGRDERLNKLYPFFNTADQSGSGPRKRELPYSAVKKPEVASSAAGSTAAERPFGAEVQPRKRSEAKKNLRVSFAADLPLREEQSATPSEKVRSEESRVPDPDPLASATTDEERQFLLYGFGRTRARGLCSESGQSIPAVAASAKEASAAVGQTKPSAFGWKLWPSALRRKRSKQIVTQGPTAADNDQLLVNSYSPSLSAQETRRSRGASQLKNERAITQARGALVDASASGANSLTPISQKADTNEIAASAETAAEVKAERNLGGLHCFRQRLSLGRERAIVPLQQQQHQLRTVERPSLVQPFVPASSQLPGGGSGSTCCGYSDESSGGQPFSAAGIASPFLVESNSLPPVSLYSSHGLAGAKEELVFAAEGGGTTAAAAHTGGRSFWWRAEARASRTFGCSKGFAGGLHVPSKESENSLLQQHSQEQQQQYLQQVQRQASQQQQPHGQQQRHLLNQQEVLQLQQQEILQQHHVLKEPQLQQQQVLQQQQQVFLQQQRQTLQQQQVIHRQGPQQPHQVAQQVALSKSERLWLQQKEGIERAFQWQPEQPVWKEGAGEGGPLNAAEPSSEKRQNNLFGFSFSFRQAKQTYFATQQEAVYESACERSYPATGQRLEKLQQQVSDVHLQQEPPVQQQQSRQEQSRSKREQRLQRKLTIHRRLPSIRSISANDIVGSWTNLPHAGIRGLETRARFAAFSKKEEGKFTFSSPLLIAEVEKTASLQETWRAGSSGSDPPSLSSLSHCVGAEARSRVRLYSDSAVPAATAQLSFGNSRDASVYATARNSTVVGFSGAATPSTDKEGQAISGDSATVLGNHARTGPPAVSLYNSTSSFREQSRHKFARNTAASPTILSRVTEGAADTSLSMLPSAGATVSLPVANTSRPGPGGGATGANPATAAPRPLRLEAPAASASAAGVGKTDVLSHNLIAAPGKQGAGGARERPGDASTAGTASASEVRGTSIKEVPLRTTAGKGLSLLANISAASLHATSDRVVSTPKESGAVIRKAPETAKRILTGKPVSEDAREKTPVLAPNLSTSQQQQQEQSDHWGQQRGWDTERLNQLEQREYLQVPQHREEGETPMQQSQRRGKGQEQQPREIQEKGHLEKPLVSRKSVHVPEGQGLQTLKGAEKVRGSLSVRYSRQTTTPAALPAATSCAATGGTRATASVVRTAAAPTKHSLKKEENSGARRQRAAERKNVVLEGKTADEVDETSDTSDTSSSGHKKPHNSGDIVVSKEESQGLNNSSTDAREVNKEPRRGRYSLTDGRKNTGTASAGKIVSPSSASQQLQAKRGTSLRLTSLSRIVSGCCRTPVVRLTSANEEQWQHPFRRNSTSSNSSSNTSSSRRSTNSSSSSSEKFQSSSIAGDELGHKNMRFVSLSSVTTVSHRHSTFPENKTEGPSAAGAEGATAVAPVPTSFPQDGKAAAGPTGSEDNSGAPVLLKRRSSKFHAVFSSIAFAVKKGSHSISFGAGTRKLRLQKTTTTAGAAEVAATASSSTMAAAGSQHVPIAPEGSSLHTEEDVSRVPMQASTVHFVTGEVSPRSEPMAAEADGDEGDNTAAQRRYATDKRKSSEGTIDHAYIGRGSTLQEAQTGAEEKVAESEEFGRKETEDVTGVLKCYSLPKDEDIHGHREGFPDGAASVLSLDSQNSSVLSCHSFSSSSSSDSNIKASLTTAAAARKAMRQEQGSRTHGHGKREKPERAAEEDGNDAEESAEKEVEEDEEEEEEEGLWRRERKERMTTSRGEDEDTESEETEEEESFSTAGDPTETVEGEETAEAMKDQSYATAPAAGSGEAVDYVYGSKEKTWGRENSRREAEEEVEVEIQMGGRSRLQSERDVDAPEADAKSPADAGERAAERAAAKRIAAARAAADLTEAQMTAAVRATQAEAAAARAAEAREELVQVAVAAAEQAVGSEPAGGEVDAQEEDIGAYKGHRIKRHSSTESIRRRSTASSAGSTEPVIVEARGNRLVCGKSRVSAVAVPLLRATTTAEEPKREAAAGKGETVARHGGPRVTIGETRTVQPVPAAAEQRRHSSGAGRYASQAFAPGSELQGPAAAGRVVEKEMLPTGATTAAAAARAAERASAAAAGADDAAAAAAEVADAKAREAQVAEEEAEEAEVVADAMQETVGAPHTRRPSKESVGNTSPGEDYEADVSEIRRYATEFLLEEAVEEPSLPAARAANPALLHGRERGRESLRQLSSGATRFRQQHSSGHGVEHAQPGKHAVAVRSGTAVQQQHLRQHASDAEGQYPARRRSHVLSREEELAAIAGKAPHLIEEEEDGAAVLARKAEVESRNRRGSRRFALPQHSDGGSNDTAATLAVQTAAAVTSDAFAAAAAKTTAAVARDVAASLAADVADAEVAAAEKAGVEAVSRGLHQKNPSAEERRASRRSHSLRQIARKQGTDSAENSEGGGERIWGSERRKNGQERNREAAGSDEREDVGMKERLPPEQQRYASSGAPPRYPRRRSLVQEEQRRVPHTGPGPLRKTEEVSAIEGGGGGIRRRQTSAVQAPPYRAWSTLAQIREGGRQSREEAEAAEKRRDVEQERDHVDHHKDLIQRRSLQEKHLVKRLLRHRTLQSPLLTVPPPFNLQNSPVLQAVYSRGDGGAAEAVVRAASDHKSRCESRD